jgi:hypothetical protein
MAGIDIALECLEPVAFAHRARAQMVNRLARPVLAERSNCSHAKIRIVGMGAVPRHVADRETVAPQRGFPRVEVLRCLIDRGGRRIRMHDSVRPQRTRKRDRGFEFFGLPVLGQLATGLTPDVRCAK